MKKKSILFFVFIASFQIVKAQGIAITADNSAPHGSSMLDVQSTSKGVLLPRMTETQKKAIASPANGLIIFQTDAQKGLYVYDGSWKPLTDQLGNHLATENLRLGGYRLSNSDTTVGISIDEKGAVRFKTKPQTGDPVNRFFFDPSGAIASTGKLSEGSLPAYGEGARFMWYPGKAALRAGELLTSSVNLWSEDSVGRASVAIGLNNAAAGTGAAAFGEGNSSASQGAFSAGSNNRSYGPTSITLGSANTCTGITSIAIGQGNTIDSRNSIIIGTGNSSTINGRYSIAIGTDIRLDHQGSLVFGDRSGVSTIATTDNNQFLARYAGGYTLYSSANISSGVRLLPGSNAWSVISDSAKKENFLPADGELMLNSLRSFKLGSWNYKGNNQRHYGPMAQEFFAAYGKDKHGVIGNDTTINQADMDGIMMILIHALEDRSNKQKQEISTLRQSNAELISRLTEAESQAKKIDMLLTLMKKNDATKALAAQVEAACTSKEGSCCNKE